MVRRSLEAANAISAGNNISLIASATMIGLCREIGVAQGRERAKFK